MHVTSRPPSWWNFNKTMSLASFICEFCFPSTWPPKPLFPETEKISCKSRLGLSRNADSDAIMWKKEITHAPHRFTYVICRLNSRINIIKSFINLVKLCPNKSFNQIFYFWLSTHYLKHEIEIIKQIRKPSHPSNVNN